MSTATEITARVDRAALVNMRTVLATLSIGGNIVDGSAAALEGVVVTAKLNGVTLASVLTDASGDYVFPAGFRPNTSYDLYAPLTGYTPDEDPLVVPLGTASVTDADFVLTAD